MNSLLGSVGKSAHLNMADGERWELMVPSGGLMGMEVLMLSSVRQTQLLLFGFLTGTVGRMVEPSSRGRAEGGDA